MIRKVILIEIQIQSRLQHLAPRSHYPCLQIRVFHAFLVSLEKVLRTAVTVRGL